MRALILSGGSNRGALQVGAMRALLERNISFDIVVGVSIGALNGAYFSYKPNLEGIEELERIWLSVKRETIFKEGRIKALIRFVKNEESIFSNDAFYKFVLEVCPVRTFAELELDFYVPAVDIDNYEVYIFGENKYDSLPDALMASSALPPYFPPWEYKGRRFVDGGFFSNLPYKVAIDKGAREIYALHIKAGRSFDDKVYSIYGLISKSFDYLLQAKIKEHEVEAKKHKARIHYIPLEPEQPLSIFDFSKTKELIQRGYELASKYLEGEMQEESLWNKLRRKLFFFKR